METAHQPQLPFPEGDRTVDQQLQVDKVLARQKPEGIPEDAWAAMQGLRVRNIDRGSTSLGGRQVSRADLEREGDIAYLRGLRRR
jgi:hypothetical protein